MRHVIDHDGDWFAVRPYTIDFGQPVTRLPDVGTVLANVRVAGHTTKYHAWADPQFVRVAEVLPIVDTDELPQAGGEHIEIMFHDGDAPLVLRWDLLDGEFDCASHPAFDLPGAVPGGWAIRVEPADCPDWAHGLPESACPLCTQPPVIEGKALNR